MLFAFVILNSVAVSAIPLFCGAVTGAPGEVWTLLGPLNCLGSGGVVLTVLHPTTTLIVTAPLIGDIGFNVIQVGASNDKKIKNQNVIDLTGKLTFKQNAELIKKCSAFVGVDSGPAYLAG